MTVQFSPEQHAQAGKWLGGQPRAGASATPSPPETQSPASLGAIVGTLPGASHPPQRGMQLQDRACSSLTISTPIKFAGSKFKATDEGVCLLPASSLSLPRRQVTSLSVAHSLHPFLRALKPTAGKSRTEKAASSGRFPARLGTERGGQPGVEGERQALTPPGFGDCSSGHMQGGGGMAVAASVPAPAATSPTKWRSAAACRDGRAHHTPAVPGGAGGCCPAPLPRLPATGLLQVLGCGRVAERMLSRFLVLPEPHSQGVGPEQAGDPSAQGVRGARGGDVAPWGRRRRRKRQNNGAAAGLLPRSQGGQVQGSAPAPPPRDHHLLRPEAIVRACSDMAALAQLPPSARSAAAARPCGASKSLGFAAPSPATPALTGMPTAPSSVTVDSEA